MANDPPLDSDGIFTAPHQMVGLRRIRSTSLKSSRWPGRAGGNAVTERRERGECPGIELPLPHPRHPNILN